MCLLIGFPIVTTVKLAGPCPNLAPTQYLTNTTLPASPQIIVGISFEPEHPSHLFRNINQSTLKAYVFTLGVNTMDNQRWLSISIAYHKWVPSPIESSVHRGIITNSSQSISIESKFYGGEIDSNVSDVIHEDIKIWVVGDVFILWSCINASQTHDEAVMLLVKDDFTSENKTLFEEIIRELNMIVREYLTNDFVNTIIWPTEVPGLYNPNGNGSKVSSHFEARVLTFLVLLVFLVLFVTFACLSNNDTP